jgi:hypothetical protein
MEMFLQMLVLEYGGADTYNLELGPVTAAKIEKEWSTSAVCKAAVSRDG